MGTAPLLVLAEEIRGLHHTRPRTPLAPDSAAPLATLPIAPRLLLRRVRPALGLTLT